MMVVIMHLFFSDKREMSVTPTEYEFLQYMMVFNSKKKLVYPREAADQAKDDFFQNVSHELRTPLMSIRGYAQGIEQGIFADPKNDAAIIASESQRLKDLVDGIITISKLDNDNVALQLCTICLGDFVSESMEQLLGVNMLSGISATFHSPEEDIMVTADARLLSESFQNIISNCFRYAAAQINIEIVREEGQIYLTVEDDGPGF